MSEQESGVLPYDVPLDLTRNQEKKIRAYVMLKELLDLERPIISNNMVDFLEQDGVMDLLLNFITRFHTIPTTHVGVEIRNENESLSAVNTVELHANGSDTHKMIDTDETTQEDDNDETVLNRRSWQAIDLLSKPSSTAFGESIEKHLPHMLEILFTESFAPENTQCNYYHFMKLMENLLTNHRARIFEVLRRKNLVLTCVVPSLSRHPMIVHLLLYLIEMSQPLTSSNGNNFIIKRRFQAHLAQNELLQRVLRDIYTNALSGTEVEAQCEAACEFFTRAINELCVQEKGRKIQFERNRRNAREREKYLGKEYIEEEKRAKQNEKGTDDPEEEELDCVGDLLKTLITSDHDYDQMLKVLLHWDETTYTSRQCCARILLYLIDRTHPENENNVIVHYTSPTAKWEEEEEEEEILPVDPNLCTMQTIHEHIMDSMLNNVSVLCEIISKDYQNYSKNLTNRHCAVRYSAYDVKFSFTTLRMDMIQILHKTIQYMYKKIADDQTTPFARLVKADDTILRVLFNWFFDYKFNNMYHNLFNELLCELITNGEQEVLECILEKNDFLTRMIRTYLSDEITDNRAHIMHVGNLLRLMFDTLDPRSYLYKYLKNHEEWRLFLPILRRDTLATIKKTDESEIEIGSEFAEDLGFVETDRFNRPLSPKNEKTSEENVDNTKNVAHEQEDVFEFKE
jgi:hypothetical protein